ncbi:MAG: hypothetical protein K6A95_01720 [Bacteroidales bacterium]|jgi:hypothetical protein|nr:hypothetical protein [Bacteroidales bacterium]
MSEPANKPNNSDFGRRLHNSWDSQRKKRSTKGIWNQILLIAVGIALVAAMIYIILTL